MIGMAKLSPLMILPPVVFAALGTQGVSVISMRPASARERSLL